MTPLPTSTNQVLAHVDGFVGWLTMNRPERHNALSNELLDGLSRLLTRWETDPTIRVVILRGAGDRSFVSGADIAELVSGAPANSAMVTTTKPVIAMIQGYCIGGGLALAVEADLRIASNDSEFGIPAGRLGVAYPVEAVARLVGLIGTGQSSRLLLTAQRIDATEAQRIGLIHEVTTRDRLESRVRELANAIGENAPLTMQASKLAIASAGSTESSGSATLRVAADEAAARCWSSTDFVEGRTAFSEKRTPRWSGS
jgi:enoyl-CoA hydratase